MSLLWAVPALAAVAGAALLVVQLRAIAAAAGELGDELRALDQVQAAVARVRAEADVGAATVTRLRAARPGRSGR